MPIMLEPSSPESTSAVRTDALHLPYEFIIEMACLEKEGSLTLDLERWLCLRFNSSRAPDVIS